VEPAAPLSDTEVKGQGDNLMRSPDKEVISIILKLHNGSTAEFKFSVRSHDALLDQP